MGMEGAPTVTDVDRLFFVGLRKLNNPDIVATDADPPPPGPTHTDHHTGKCPLLTVEAAWKYCSNSDGNYRTSKRLNTNCCLQTEAERIELPEASTERVWSWELQVDGGQEPFSLTGTDRGDGGARLEVRGARLEAVVWRSVVVVWRRSSGGPWRSSGGAHCRLREGREPCSTTDAER
ncbi:unnamed protein product [Arctogadus glacialis]